MQDESILTSRPGRLLLAQEIIQDRVAKLGHEITTYYRGEIPCFLGLMNGALFFFADLLRALELEVELHCVRLASYQGQASTGTVSGLEALDALAAELAGRRVVVVDDILDTGTTLAACVARLHQLGAAEVKTCVLLEKQRPRVVEIKADWVGFSIADEFVVGYGLDENGRYRNWPEVWVLGANPSSKRDYNREILNSL